MALQKSIGAYCDEIIAELGYNSIDRKLDRRNVIIRMDIIRTELMGVLAQGGVISGGQSQIRAKQGAYEFNDIYYLTKNLPITYDATRLRYTSTMPTEYLTFEGNSGVRLIRPKQAVVGSNYFIQQKFGASLSYGSLESSNLAGMVGWEIEGQTIWYNNMPANTYEEVLISYLAPLTAFSETDLLPCNGEVAAVLMDKTKLAFMEQLQINEDKVIDSKSNP